MRNAVAAILASAMLVISVLIALDLAFLLRAPLPIAASDTAGEHAATREPLIATFYDAANAVLAGNPSPLLGTVISPDIETHDGPGPAGSGERGVLDYLERLRQRGAGARSVAQLIGSGDEVAAVVETHAMAPAALDTGERSSPRWRTVDLFRVTDGMIAGYWPGQLDYLAPPPSLPALAMPASAEAMSVSLARLELAPGADPTPFSASVPHLLIVETGVLAVSRRHAFEIARAGSSRFVAMAADPGAGELIAAPGDSLLFPRTLAHAVHNPGQSSASALSLLVASNSLIFGQIRAGSATTATVEGMHDGWRIGSRTMWDNAVVTEPLAVKHLALNRDLADIALAGSQVSLELGERLPPLHPGKLRLAIVRSGVVGVSVINSDAVPISVPNPDSVLATASNHLFRAGDAFWIEASEAPVLANAGMTPLDILLVTIGLDEEASGATPAPYATEPRET